MAKKIVAIIDYQMSNLFSVKHACDQFGIDAQISSDKNFLSQADGAILPGMGAFGDAMKFLNKSGLSEAIIDFIKKGKPFLGVCLGLQLVFEESEEFGTHKGLGIFRGKVVKFPDKNKKGEQIRVPQIGWNKINIQKKDPILSGIKQGEFVYFVHSYFVAPKEKDVYLSTTNYEGVEYVSAISKNNAFAVQFHPEKSGQKGIKIYQNFSKILNKA